jgi:hypothetical protein
MDSQIQSATGHNPQTELAWSSYGNVGNDRALWPQAREGAGCSIGRPRKMTPHQRQEALRRLAAGETQADVARTYNVDATTIGRLLGDRPFHGGASLAALQ